MRTWAVFFLLASLAAAQGSQYGISRVWWDSGQDDLLAWDGEYSNRTGQLRVSNVNGAVRTSHHPFFEALGKNGRACVTCHQPANAMSVSVEALRERWEETNGKDPVFAAIDGSNCPSLSQGERASHSLLLDRGLFRIALPWPPKDVKPDFRVEVIRDPTGCNQGHGEISVYRRPRMTANLTDLVPGPQGAVFMADGREPTLRDQAVTAALIHEEAIEPPSAEQLRRILEFETQVYASQYSDIRGGLIAEGNAPARGVQQEFRTSVARGHAVFASRCASCHEPGSTRWRRIATAPTPELPMFRITCDSGAVVETQDPGRGLISGKCADVGAIVVPQFRGLAARAPYFSNGSAGTLEQLVDSYETRLKIRFTSDEKQDLVNYLSSL